MKKSTVRVTVAFVVMIVIVIGFYAYLSGKSRAVADDVKMTQIQLVLSRDMQNDYPPTVKEVIKYYMDIQKCLYNEECTDEDVEQLGLRARELYDTELLENNEEEMNLQQLRAEVASFRSDEKKITSITVASSVNVDTFTEDGYDLPEFSAAIQCLKRGRVIPHLPYIFCVVTRTGDGRFTAGTWLRMWMPGKSSGVRQDVIYIYR